MAISGTDAEMKRIKAVVAAHDMPVARLIHAAVAHYDKNSATDSAPFDALSSDPLDEIKALLSKIVDSQNPKGGGTKVTAKGLDGVPKQLDEIHQMFKALSQAVNRELPDRGNLLDQPSSIYSLPSFEAVQMVCALLHNLVETGKFEVKMGEVH